MTRRRASCVAVAGGIAIGFALTLLAFWKMGAWQ